MNLLKQVFLLTVVLAACPGLAGAAPADALHDAVAAWHFKGLDDSAGANSALEIQGAVTVGEEMDGPAAAASKARGGDGYAADCVGGFLVAGQGAGGELNLGSSAMSLYARLLNPTGDWATTCGIASMHGGRAQLTYNLYVNGGKLGFHLGTEDGNFGVDVAAGELSEAADWQDVVIRYDGRTLEMFVDGLPVAERPASGKLRSGNTEPLILAGYSRDGKPRGPFKGKLDTVALWDRSLDDVEVAALSGGEEAAERQRAEREEAVERQRAERREAWYASLIADGVIRSDGPQAAQDVFFSAISEPQKAWGEPSIHYDNETYYMIYDYFPTPLGFALATSKDGVYWKDHGFIIDKDEDVDDIECTYVNRYQEDGPWVMQYAFRRKQDYGRFGFRMRFAVSEDGRNWKKLGPESNFMPDPRFYSTDGRWDTIDSWPKGDGTHYGIWNAYPKEGSGFGFGTTRDGIHWEQRPPVRVKVPKKGPGPTPAGELGGFFQFGDRYYLLYTARQNHLSRQEFIVSSQRVEGPYAFTPRNNYRLESPHIYPRYYRLPGGVFGTEMFWVRRDGQRYYHVPPLKKVVREDESLWLKWWEANDKLKVHEIALSAPEAVNDGDGYRRFDLPETIDFSRGTVIEGKLRLGKKTATPRNFARDAAVTGTPGVEDINKAGGFEARNAVDGDPATYWRPDVAQGEKAELRLDLGAVRSIGHIRIESRTVESVELSADGKTWHPAPHSEDYEPETFTANAGNFRFCHYYEPLDARARYVRITNRAPSEARRFRMLGITDIGIFEAPCLTAGREDSALAGLVLERSGDKDYAVLIGPDSTVMFGPLDKDGSPFRYGLHRNLDIDFGDEADFRLIIRGDMGEFYVNDYQVALINLSGPNRLTGKIGFVGSGGERAISDLKAWHSDPRAAEE